METNDKLDTHIFTASLGLNLILSFYFDESGPKQYRFLNIF